MMRSIDRTGLALALTLLAGCGGGGGGSSVAVVGATPTPTPSPAPSVVFTAAVSRALVSEPVAVTWSATNATGCTASGDWSGALAASGTQTVRFTGSGTRTLTIACAGAGGTANGSASITVSDVTTNSVPTDVASLAYPTSYTTATTRAADISTDPCAAGLTTVSVPQAWTGRYPLPAVTGAPLATAIARGIMMNDVWQPNDPFFVPGCATTTARAEWTRTLTRLKALGADYVTLTPWTFIGQNADGSWYIWKQEDLNTSTMGDADLAWAVGEAHRFGLKVTWLNQIQGLRNGGADTFPASTTANVAKFFAAERPYLLARASFLQSIGVDSMDVGCACWTLLENNFPNEYEAFLQDILPQIRARFSGRLRMNLFPNAVRNATIMANTDDFVKSLFWNLSAADVPGLTVASFKANLRNAFEIDVRASGYTGLTKPVIFNIGAPSRADFYTSGYLEETFCTSGFDMITASATACIQRNQTVDLSLQAQHYEAYLELIAEQSQLRVGGVEAGPYWLTEPLVASDTFPNLAYSPRNKPAEGILKRWFAR